MAEEDSAQEKSEEPTAKKLEKSREEGQLPRSKDLSTSVVLIASVLSVIAFGPIMVLKVTQIAKFNFQFDRQAAIDKNLMLAHLNHSAMEGFISLIPLFTVLLIAAIAGPILVSGWNFSAKSISPKFSKMNPLSGLKKMVSTHALVELLKAWAKVLVVGIGAILVIISQFNDIRWIVREDVFQGMEHVTSILFWSIFFICCSTLVIAAIDVPFQLYSHNKKMKMTLQEVKDEYKNTEGKPEVKARVRQLQREVSQRKMMSQVPDADVIITNPDHFAVALKYTPNEMPAPVLLGKGTDLVAEKIKEIAKEYNIPIVQSPPLARSIYHFTEIGQEIPEGLYMAVAQILAYIFQLNQYQSGYAQKPGDLPDFDIPEDLRFDV